MKRLWKMIPICLLALALVISITLLTPKADAATESDLTFKLNSVGNGYTVSDCNTSASGELVIPATYNGKPVTTIGNSAFQDCSRLTSITIPDSVTTIRDYAFYGCSSLTSVTIPDSVTTIGNEAFYRCDRLTGVIIPTGVIQLEENTFRDCENLKSVVILEGVTDIAYHSFFASGLETIAIPESVASISTAAFEGTDDLRDVYYGGSQEQWEQITISYFNESLLRANIHFNHIHNFVDGICAECMIPGGSDQPQGVPGDLTGDNQTNNEDVVLLLWHTLFPEDYPLGVSGDINKNGRVNNDDVVLLLWHTLFPEDYPL